MNTIFDHALWVSPLFWTLMLLGVAIILFVHNKIRMDVVALLVMLSFYLSGILSIQEILVGFSDPNIILIALLFIVGESLVRTGIAYRVSDGILKVAGNSAYFTDVFSGWIRCIYEFYWRGCGVYSCCDYDLPSNEYFPKTINDAVKRSGINQWDDDVNRDSS